MKSYLEIPPKVGKNVGIHFYENTPSEIKLPLQTSNQMSLDYHGGSQIDLAHGLHPGYDNFDY